MSQSISRATIVFTILLLMSSLAISGPLEEGFVAYKQGDKELAHNKWLPLAIKGDVRAQFFLSVLLENRAGGIEDQDNAKKWLTASANNGFVPARFNLGNNYHTGKYGAVNNKMAEYWWNQAAVQGFAEAQYHLATLYYWGKSGVKLNLKEAFYWFEQAAKQGYQDASEAVLLIRAGEPLQPPKADEPFNIAYDDHRIMSKLSLESKQIVAISSTQKAKPEPIAISKQSMQKEVAAPAPTLTEKVDVNLSIPERSETDWSSQQLATNYTIQLFASTRFNECNDQIKLLSQRYRLESHLQSFIKGGRKYCAVIYGSYKRYSAAKIELSQLPQKIKQAGPWIRKMAR